MSITCSIFPSKIAMYDIINVFPDKFGRIQHKIRIEWIIGFVIYWNIVFNNTIDNPCMTSFF